MAGTFVYSHVFGTAFDKPSRSQIFFSFAEIVAFEGQAEYGDALEALERAVIEQLAVDPEQVAGAEPGVAPISLPPDVLKRLEEFAEGDGTLPPPETIDPIDP